MAMDSLTASAGPTRGQIVDGVHLYPLRVYYEDTDAAGIVYYANYLRFVERARTELLRDIGAAHEQMKKDYGVEFVVKSVVADYLQPAFLDDSLEVRTTRSETKGASVTLRQVVARGDEKLVVTEIKIAARSQTTGGAARIPADVKTAFEQLMEDGSED